MLSPQRLQEFVAERAYYPLIPSRVHQFEDNLYLKRDDELSSSIQGSKFRKISTLIYWLKKEGHNEVSLCASAYSAMAVGMATACKEAGISLNLYLRASREQEVKGNHLLIKLLMNEEKIHNLTGEQWKDRMTIAGAGKTLVLDEGAPVASAALGCASIAAELILKGNFERVWIDSGSAVALSGLRWGLELLNYQGSLNAVLLAGDQAFAERQYQQLKDDLHNTYPELGKSISVLEVAYHKPATAAAYGSINSQVKQNMRQLATNYGLLADPIYLAKYLPVVLEHEKGKEDLAVAIHTSGAIGLLGFSELLKS